MVRQPVDLTFGRAEIAPKIATFSWDGNYIENDWRTQPNGEGYLGKIATGRPDLRRKVRGLIYKIEPELSRVQEEFAKKYG